MASITADLHAVEPVPDGLIKMDGAPTYDANMVQIDFFKDAFDRETRKQPSDLDAEGDPPPLLFLKVANDLLGKVRSINKSSFIRPLSADDTFWRIHYLNDDGSELSREEDKFRGRFVTTYREHLAGINSATWTQIANIPFGYEPPIWDKLLLDAEDALPDVGAAVVLAATALETLAKAVSDHVAAGAKVSPDLWDWINDRANFLKDPSVEERLDSLLRIFTKRSLKDEASLWEAFKNLKDARNSCVHEGQPMLGGKVLGIRDANPLITRARLVVSWLEQFLDPSQRSLQNLAAIEWRGERPVA